MIQIKNDQRKAACLPLCHTLLHQAARKRKIVQVAQRVVAGHLLQARHAQAHLVDIGGLADGAHIAGRLVVGPSGPRDKARPARLAANIQPAVELHHGVLRRGGVQLGGKLLQIGIAQNGPHRRVGARVHQHLVQPQPLCAPGRNGDERRIDRIFKLDLLRHRREEAVFHALVLQKAQGPVGRRHIVLPAHRLCNALRFLRRNVILQRLFQLPAQAGGVFPQAIQQQRIKGAAFPCQDHFYRALVRIRGLVHALARQRVVHIGQRHHLRRDGDLVAGKPVRVSAAVPALMVPAADGVRHLHQRLVPVHGQGFHHPRALRRVRFHHLKFLGRQAAVLVKDPLGNGDLADIVQRGRGGDHLDLLGPDLVAVGFCEQLAQKQIRQHADVQHVRAALAVAELHNMAQHIHHQRILPLVLVDLLHQLLGKLLLLAAQKDRIDYAPLHHHFVERPADKIRAAKLIRALNVRAVAFGRDHNHRHVVDPALGVHLLQHAEAVHLRHHDIQKHQRKLALVLLQHRNGLDAVLRLDDLVIFRQHHGKDRAVHLRVVHNQDLLAAFTLFHIRSPHFPYGSTVFLQNARKCPQKAPAAPRALPARAGYMQNNYTIRCGFCLRFEKIVFRAADCGSAGIVVQWSCSKESAARPLLRRSIGKRGFL